MSVKKYTKNPITIRTLQFTTNYQELIDFVNNRDVLWVEDGVPYIKTLEGELKVSCFDYVIEGIHGEFYPCKPEIFEASYKEAANVPDTLPDHMRRVYLELQDLTQRQVLLQKYISKKCPGASKDEVYLLDTQLALMIALSNTLRNRLSLYGPAPSIKVSLVYAISSNGVFGQDGKLPWHDTPIKEDFQHFKDVTIGKHVVMGSKTFDSLGRKPLPHRRNYIITSRMEEYDDVEDAGCFNSLEEMLNAFRATWVDEVLVIGGGGLLSEALKYADTVYETVVDKEFPIDEKTIVFDPDLDNNGDFRLEKFNLSAPWGTIRTFKRV